MFEIFVLSILIMSGCMALMYFGRTKINPFKKDDDK